MLCVCVYTYVSLSPSLSLIGIVLRPYITTQLVNRKPHAHYATLIVDLLVSLRDPFLKNAKSANSRSETQHP